jgi:tetratricopeptide (TPR) repeat protein
VAEEIEGPEAATTGAETPSAAVDPAAIALALGGASRAEADAFLKNQGSLTDLQKHHLNEQFKQLPEQLKQLRLATWEKRLGVLLRLATAFVGIAVASALALMVWDAAHSKGLVIEPFSVPADMAERGITGQVVASQMIDKLTEMTTHESSRAAQSYANNWGDDIKVEIPETGVSISELQRFLREWLGHDIRISGEVYRTATGVAVTARTSGEAGATAQGSENDLDGLVQKAAEYIYEVTQPYRYANYLDRNYDPNGLADRVARATAIYRKLIAGDDLVERAWALNGLGTIEYNFHGNDRLAADYYRKAIATTPDFTIAYYALSSRDQVLDREEEDLANLHESDLLLSRDPVPGLNPHYAIYARASAKGLIATLTGDYAVAIPVNQAGAELPDDFSVLGRGNFTQGALQAMILQHDLSAMRAYARYLGPSGTLGPETRVFMSIENGDWRQIDDVEAAARARIAQASGADPRFPRARAQTNYDRLRPWFALGKARQGDFKAAEAMIAPAAPDDDLALRVRGLIAEIGSQHERADWWFARAEARAPHVPFADEMWGRVLLDRGQPDAAIGKFTLANRKGPHFADPLEGWGEALVAKKQPDQALAKFTEAEKYAPNWGRLHLKWGQALLYAGEKDAARKQFALASGLDLSAADKAELERMSAQL